MQLNRFVSWLAVTAGFMASSLAAADFDQQRFPDEKEWRVIVSPYVWAASLKGNASLAGFDTDVEVPFSDTFDHLDLAFMGNVEVTNGTWGAFIDLQHVKTSQGEELQSQQLDLGITMNTVEGGIYYRAYEAALGGETVFGQPRRLSVEPLIGVRWSQLKGTVEALGRKVEKQSDWWDPFVGLRVNIDLSDRWNLFTEADIGGFDVGSKFTVNAQSYLGYRTMMLGQPTILRAGYRVLYQDYETNDFTGNHFRWNVTQHGPVVGLSMQF
ncbi:hypothetical protein [Rhizobium sp. Root1204]|uniref:hypothetical protein n=1 Tax=Rhizobium sp. Root1204 TaxID=1736428 RepID=UPI000B32D9F3|nr:hypothetical protein [Rhizobium sp. Root1204]